MSQSTADASNAFSTTMRLPADDRIDINELIARSHYFADFGHYDAMRTCYLDEADNIVEGIGRYSGAQWQIDHAKVSARNTENKNRHVVTGLWIEPKSADEAIAHYFMLNVNAGHAVRAATLVVTGEFRDLVVRRDDGWKIASRHFFPDQSFEMKNGGV